MIFDPLCPKKLILMQSSCLLFHIVCLSGHLQHNILERIAGTLLGCSPSFLPDIRFLTPPLLISWINNTLDKCSTCVLLPYTPVETTVLLDLTHC